MSIDATAIGILFGLVVTALFASLEFHRHGLPTDIQGRVGDILLLFLAAQVIPPFLQLIWATILNDPNNMPSGWRGYLAAAAVTGIWLAGTHLYRIFSKVLGTTSRLGNESDRR